MLTEFSLIKIQCTQEMVGKNILIPGSDEAINNIDKFPFAEKMACVIKYKFRHNIERHDLFYACIKLVSENIDKSRVEIIEQCKLDCRWFEGYTYYKDKHGKDRVNVITKSIAFSAMNLKDADEFYGKAFDVLAKYLKITTEELTNEAKLNMKGKYYCVGCGKRAVQKHHLFSQTKWAIEKYGKKMIDAEFNKVWVCPDCHTSHSNIPKEYIWTERKFISEADKRGYITKTNKEDEELEIF